MWAIMRKDGESGLSVIRNPPRRVGSGTGGSSRVNIPGFVMDTTPLGAGSAPMPLQDSPSLSLSSDIREISEDEDAALQDHTNGSCGSSPIRDCDSSSGSGRCCHDRESETYSL